MGQAADVCARDFDLDGDMDFVVSTLNPGGIYYYDRRPDSTYRFQPLETGAQGRQITSGDFDHDGDLDVVYALSGDDQLILLRNNPANPPATRFTVSVLDATANGPFAVLGGDFTGDGLDDLVATDVIGTDRVRLFRQINGVLENIQSNSFYGGTDPLGIALTDIEHDGVTEILLGMTTLSGGLFMMRRTHVGTYTVTHEVEEAYLAAIAAGDLDGDGDVDVLGCEFDSDIIKRWEHTETGWFATHFPTGLNNPRDVVIADFDSDDLLDFAATGQGQQGVGGGVIWWRQTSNGTFVAQQISHESGFWGLEPADYDRDGDIDLLAANAELQQIILFENRMGTPTRIMGTVTAERGGTPISDVRVTVDETGVSALTDASGRYELGMIEGTFTLRFRHPCWAEAELTGVRTFTDDTTFADRTMRRPVMELPVTSLNLFVQNDESTTYDMRIDNSGDADLTVAPSISEAAPNFSWVTVEPAELQIAPGEEGVVTVTFAPDTSDDRAYEILGYLRIRSNSCPDTSIELALVIIVLDAPEIETDLFPQKTQLGAAFPNPFNPAVTIPVEISERGEYSIKVYDVLGRNVAALYSGTLAPGRMSYIWNAEQLASGRYIAVLQSASGARYETSLVLIK